ncbi:MAG: M81 family metallopeptidase, partial [Gemmatimonadetes bacterium]|nr:M81 family metallopeptidase [Gemmatimonadota bacterium]
MTTKREGSKRTPGSPRGGALSATAALAATLLGCGSPSGDDVAPLRFAVASYQHETCTFCPGGDTEVDDWLRYSEPVSGDALLGAGDYIGGFVQRAGELGDIELVPLTSPLGVFGGSSRSWNTRETFEHFLDAM